MNIRESEVAAGVAVGELFVVEADELQQGCVQVVNIASADTATGQPHGQAPVIMVPAVDFSGTSTFLRQLDCRCPAEFASPDDQCFIQQPALPEVREQRADYLIALLCEPCVIDSDIIRNLLQIGKRLCQQIAAGKPDASEFQRSAPASPAVFRPSPGFIVLLEDSY